MNRKAFLYKLQLSLLGLGAIGHSSSLLRSESLTLPPLKKAPYPSSQGKPNTDYDVIIIGAGASGLYAADLLHKANKSILILEANERVGGRVFSHELKQGEHVELGANWMAREGQNRLKSLANQYGFGFNTNHENGKSIYLTEEKKIIHTIDENPLSFFASIDVLQLGYKLDSHAKKMSFSDPNQNQKELDQVSVSDWLQASSWKSESRNSLEGILSQGMCQDLNKISVYETVHQWKTLGSSENLEGADSLYFPLGFQNIFKRIGEKFGKYLHLKEKVISIVQKDDTVFVKTKQRSYSAKDVILAIPPHLRREIDFFPALPSVHKQILKNFLHGIVTKCIAVYQTPWWRNLGYSGQITTETEGFRFFADVSYGSGQGILVGIVGGTSAESLYNINNIKLADIFQRNVTKAFGKKVTPIDFFHHNWNKDPFIQGAYAGRRMIGDWNLGGNILSDPFGKIHFAGTETASEWRSYVEGALQSGERVVNEILLKTKV
ncbi:MAG: FAD-dependent oxidoreductase [Leptospiraceae bacterium]|nr:FAD-dependent oxidoreductase [Leptospiraceae bacterium]MCZ8346484.1 FAD-dependent oxidoreductase [Leptospiraceae bacterium]